MTGSPLRAGLYAVGALFLAGGVLLAALGGAAVPPAIWLLGMGILLVVGLLVERWRYKRLDDPRPGPDWQATGERFVDPESGKLVTVYFHPRTGERRYVAL